MDHLHFLWQLLGTHTYTHFYLRTTITLNRHAANLLPKTILRATPVHFLFHKVSAIFLEDIEQQPWCRTLRKNVTTWNHIQKKKDICKMTNGSCPQHDHIVHRPNRFSRKDEQKRTMNNNFIITSHKPVQYYFHFFWSKTNVGNNRGQKLPNVRASQSHVEQFNIALPRNSK